MKHFTLAIVALTALCSTALAQNKVQKTIYADRNLDIEQLSIQPTQLNRILLAGYNTICLPMTLSAEQLQKAGNGVQVERLAAIRQDGETLNLYFLDCTAEGIQAGVPYLIYSPKTQYLRARTLEAANIDGQLTPVTLSDQQGNRVTFTSSWSQLEGDGRYGIPAKQETDELQSILIRTQPDQHFLPTRCGFIWEQQAKSASSLKIKHVTNLNDLQTDIQTLKAQDAVVDVYDTAGALVRSQVRMSAALQNLPKGIYVIGGEKVLVK